MGKNSRRSLIGFRYGAGNSATLRLIHQCGPSKLSGTSVAMCDPFRSLRSAVMSCLLKKHGSSPEPIGSINDTNAPENGPIRGITKVPQDMVEDVLSCLDQMIQNETKSPRRRENIGFGRDFVREHGWPEKGCCIWVLKEVVFVLTEEQLEALPKSRARVDAFVLVSSQKLISPYFGLFLCVCVCSRGCI